MNKNFCNRVVLCIYRMTKKYLERNSIKKPKISENISQDCILKFAGTVRVISQRGIGSLIFASLLFRIWVRFRYYDGPYRPMYGYSIQENLEWFLSQNTLAIIGDGLALSAGVDLAYMLFTPGPDEVIMPLLTGLSATIVLMISDDAKLKLDNIEGIFLLIVGMCILLFVGFFTGLIEKDKENKNYFLDFVTKFLERK